MGRHISRRLSDGVTSIVGDFNHEANGMLNDFVVLGAKFSTWARENCGVTDAEALCALRNIESLLIIANLKRNYNELQKSCFDKIEASGLQIPIFVTN